MRIQRCGIRKKISNASTAKKKDIPTETATKFGKSNAMHAKKKVISEGTAQTYAAQHARSKDISVTSVWRNNKIKVVILDLTTSDKEEMAMWLQSIQR